MDGAARLGLLLLLCCFVLQLATSGQCRRPLIRVPRGAPTTGRYTVVLRRDLTEDQYRRALATISRLATVHAHTEWLLKTVTVDISSFALERVSRYGDILYNYTEYVSCRICCRLLHLKAASLKLIVFCSSRIGGSVANTIFNT